MKLSQKRVFTLTTIITSVFGHAINKENDIFSITGAVGFNPEASAQEPFPDWLTDFTGLTEWPGIEPPYIPLDFIDFTKVPKFPTYNVGACPKSSESCSFDCWKCVGQGDVYTCPKLSQTFDDGPSPSTLKLLENLEQKTTFFCLGINVVRFPEIYREASSHGHLMASHTYSHAFLPSLTNEQIVAQLEWSIWAQNATGYHIPKWYRPPYGAIDDRVRGIASQFGLQAVLWDYDTFDWKLLSGENTEAKILDEVRKWKKKSSSGLMLEHDASDMTVQMGLKLQQIVGHDQMKASECVGAKDYLRVFDDI